MSNNINFNKISMLSKKYTDHNDCTNYTDDSDCTDDTSRSDNSDCSDYSNYSNYSNRSDCSNYINDNDYIDNCDCDYHDNKINHIDEPDRNDRTEIQSGYNKFLRGEVGAFYQDTTLRYIAPRYANSNNTVSETGFMMDLPSLWIRDTCKNLNSRLEVSVQGGNASGWFPDQIVE